VNYVLGGYWASEAQQARSFATVVPKCRLLPYAIVTLNKEEGEVSLRYLLYAGVRLPALWGHCTLCAVYSIFTACPLPMANSVVLAST